MAEGYASNSYSVHRVYISDTTSGNANIIVPVSNAIPIYFYGYVAGTNSPVYAIFGKWTNTGDDKAIKIYSFSTATGPLANTEIEGYLYYLA